MQHNLKLRARFEAVNGCRRGSERCIREVREMEEKGLASLRAHAGKYVEALLPPADPAGAAGSPEGGDRQAAAAVRAVGRAHLLRGGREAPRAAAADAAAQRPVSSPVRAQLDNAPPNPTIAWLGGATLPWKASSALMLAAGGLDDQAGAGIRDEVHAGQGIRLVRPCREEGRLGMFAAC